MHLSCSESVFCFTVVSAAQWLAHISLLPFHYWHFFVLCLSSLLSFLLWISHIFNQLSNCLSSLFMASFIFNLKSSWVELIVCFFFFKNNCSSSCKDIMLEFKGVIFHCLKCWLRSGGGGNFLLSLHMELESGGLRKSSGLSSILWQAWGQSSYTRPYLRQAWQLYCWGTWFIKGFFVTVSLELSIRSWWAHLGVYSCR